MRKAHVFGHAARIMNVDPRAAGTFLRQGRPVIVKLQRHTHHIIAFLGQHGSDD